LIAITAIIIFAKLAFRQSHSELSGVAGVHVAAKPDGHFNLKESFAVDLLQMQPPPIDGTNFSCSRRPPKASLGGDRLAPPLPRDYGLQRHIAKQDGGNGDEDDPHR
jgi:hypothetical protein